MQLTIFADSHVHMAEPGFGDGYPDLGSADLMVSCTARPSEWPIQDSIDERRAVKCYGVHPWYADEWTPGTRDSLISMIEKGNHVGEIGLDSKRGSVSDQLGAFNDQLGLASEYDRIATIHSIGTEKEVLDSLRALHPKGVRTILHSYGSDSYVKPYTVEGCYFSVSPRILSRSDVRVTRLLKAIPADRLLLETDAPHQGKGFEGMGWFAERLANLLESDAETLAGTARDNLKRLLA